MKSSVFHHVPVFTERNDVFLSFIALSIAVNRNFLMRKHVFSCLSEIIRHSLVLL